jgi:hypothetical protein
MHFAFLLVSIAICACAAMADVSVPIQNCKGKTNLLPVYTSPPVFQAQTKNGKLFAAGGDYVSPRISVVHVWGTPYEMGFAKGTLLKNELQQVVPELMDYIAEGLNETLPLLPESWQEAVLSEGAHIVFNLTYELTKPFIAQRFLDEIQGMADASGVSYDFLLRAALTPELVQARCSIVMAFGDAIANNGDEDATLYHLRALDWDMNSPLQRYPLVTVYHPNDDGQSGHAFASVDWVGFTGSLTGISSKPVSIGEKVFLHTKSRLSRRGVPWTFLLRDILQFDQDIDSALSRIATAERTCSIFVGLGDGESDTGRVLEYTHDYLNIYNDKNFPAYANHPLMDGLVWVDKHTQPSNDPCLTTLLEHYYGEISPSVFMHNISSTFGTGNTHSVLFSFPPKAASPTDGAAGTMWVSNAGISINGADGEPAYDRQYTEFDLASLWNVAKP